MNRLLDKLDEHTRCAQYIAALILASALRHLK